MHPGRSCNSPVTNSPHLMHRMGSCCRGGGQHMAAWAALRWMLPLTPQNRSRSAWMGWMMCVCQQPLAVRFLTNCGDVLMWSSCDGLLLAMLVFLHLVVM